MEPKLTPWFPLDVKPVRRGFYDCRYCIERLNQKKRHFWTGKRWQDSWTPFLGWRGLTKRPDAAGGRT